MSAATTNFLKGILRFVDEVCTECAQTDLNKSAVEENLGIDVEISNCFLEMGHEKHIPSFVVLVVKGEVVHLTEIGPRSDDVDTMLEKIGAQRLYKGGRVHRFTSWSYLGIELRGDGFPCVFFEDGYDLCGLMMKSQRELSQ